MSCGRGCELFLNRSRKQGVSLLVSPFRDGRWTVWDLYPSTYVWVRTADNAWIRDLLDMQLV